MKRIPSIVLVNMTPPLTSDDFSADNFDSLNKPSYIVKSVHLQKGTFKHNESRYGIDSQTKGDVSRVMYDGYHRAHQGFNCGSVARRRD